MTIRYVQTNDNKYVQYRLLNSEWSTNTEDWQGSDDNLNNQLNKSIRTILQANEVTGLEARTTLTYFNANTSYHVVYIPVKAGDIVNILYPFGTMNVCYSQAIPAANVAYSGCTQYRNQSSAYDALVRQETAPSDGYLCVSSPNAFIVSFYRINSSYAIDVQTQFQDEENEINAISQDIEVNDYSHPKTTVIEGLTLSNQGVILPKSTLKLLWFKAKANIMYYVRINAESAITFYRASCLTPPFLGASISNYSTQAVIKTYFSFATDCYACVAMPIGLDFTVYCDNNGIGKIANDYNNSKSKISNLSSLYLKTIQALGLSQNLIANEDWKIPTDYYWQSGQINSKGNTQQGNLVDFTSVGVNEWQNYITAFIKVSDIKERTGVDLSDTSVTKFIDVTYKNGSNAGSMWLALRYQVNDKTNYDRGNNMDVVFNLRGEITGLGTGDTTTWVDAVFSQTTLSISNLKVPYNYQNKTLYAILLCIGGTDGNKVLNDVILDFHDVSLEKTIAFYSRSLLEDKVKELSDIILPVGLNGFYAACGDSITNANHTGIDDIPSEDPYLPIDGYSQVNTYKRKCYAYYVAKKYNLKWANYGWGGTTLTHCAPKGYGGDKHGFVDDRITQLKDGIDWNYISIFFGWNDVIYGPIYQRDLWLQNTYGEDIGYPVTQKQIGATGFATQAQKDACDSVVGTYQSNDDYFFYQFLGSINSTDKNTWYGALNYALDYLMKKYINTKMLLVVPFLGSRGQEIKEAVVAIGTKYGVTVFDFNDLPYWYRLINLNHTPFANPDRQDGKWPDAAGNLCPAEIHGYNRARLSADSTHPSNLGYKLMAGPFGDKLYNG